MLDGYNYEQPGGPGMGARTWWANLLNNQHHLTSDDLKKAGQKIQAKLSSDAKKKLNLNIDKWYVGLPPGF